MRTKKTPESVNRLPSRRLRPSPSSFLALPAGQPKKIFLSQGEDVFIAAEGEIVDRRYRVLRISPNSVEMEDVLNNNRQSIPLTQG